MTGTLQLSSALVFSPVRVGVRLMHMHWDECNEMDILQPDRRDPPVLCFDRTDMMLLWDVVALCSSGGSGDDDGGEGEGRKRNAC